MHEVEACGRLGLLKLKVISLLPEQHTSLQQCRTIRWLCRWRDTHVRIKDAWSGTGLTLILVWLLRPRSGNSIVNFAHGDTVFQGLFVGQGGAVEELAQA